jgi:predicted PurR-regulated permease PerM
MNSSAQSVPRWIWWALGIVALFWFIHAVRGILLPFVAGLAMAYLLDPLADRLEARKVPRWLATSLVLVGFILAIASIGFLLAPILRDQIGGLVEALPRYAEQVRPFINNLISRAGGIEEAKDILGSSSGKVVEFLTRQAVTLIAGGVALFNTLTLILISPVVAFYLLRDWDHLVQRVDNWLPRSIEPVAKQLMGEADKALSGFVRGQTLVCLGLGVLYALGWSLLGLNYGLLLGMLVGILSYVPTAGPAFGMLVAMVVGIGQWGTDDPWRVAGVFGVFLIAQAIEGMVLTPKFIGENVGLHPVWVLFAVFAGAQLMGVVGVFLAVPVAAVIAVLARHALQRYLASRYYQP